MTFTSININDIQGVFSGIANAMSYNKIEVIGWGGEKMWGIEKIKSGILFIVILVILITLVTNVEMNILFVISSMILVVANIRSYVLYRQAGKALYNISPRMKSNWGLGWLLIGLIYLIPSMTDAVFYGILEIEDLIRGIFNTLLGIGYLRLMLDKNRITAKGLVAEGKLYPWDRIISWKWIFQDKCKLELVVPKKSTKKPQSIISLEIPAEKVEQVNNFFYRHMYEKFRRIEI